VISPHIDDAFIALGSSFVRGLLGSVAIVNVFSRSSFTRYGYKSEPDVSKLRRREDAAVFEGLETHRHFLDFNDWSPSRWLMPDAVALSDAIVSTLGIGTHKSVLLPASVSGHPDHVSISDCAAPLLDAGFRVAYYDDFPYATDEDLNDRGTVRVLPLDEDSLVSKLRRLLRYSSQVDPVFISSVERHLRTYGGERIAVPHGSIALC
jgi:hypothetical protein